MFSYLIRDARPDDCVHIHRLIYDLAVYERMPNNVAITPEILIEDAFGAGHPPRFMALVVVDRQQQPESNIIGYCIYNESYSNFRGRALWIEDIYIQDEHRSRGLAGGIVRKLATYAQREQMAHIEWSVLAWNQLAIGFYNKLGAINRTQSEGWTLYRWTQQQYSDYLSRPPCGQPAEDQGIVIE